jgi:hypothetical protein
MVDAADATQVKIELWILGFVCEPMQAIFAGLIANGFIRHGDSGIQAPGSVVQDASAQCGLGRDLCAERIAWGRVGDDNASGNGRRGAVRDDARGRAGP